MINIALDGLSGSGKGALADGLAKKLNLIHLDTGAIFRTITCGFLKLGITEPSDEDITSNINNINVEVVIKDGKQLAFLNNEDVTANLRKEEVSKLSSKISTYTVVRDKYLEIVKNFSSNYDCIIDGRDITSIVLPNADCKIYLTADESVRAKRRYDENVLKNIDCTYEEVLENLRERDYRDMHRDIAPLIIVPDAFVVDNSNLSIDKTIDLCYDYIVKKLNLEV